MPADDHPAAKADRARLAQVLSALLAAQVELDQLGQPLAAARLDAAIEAVRQAGLPPG